MLVKSCDYDQACDVPHSRQLMVGFIPLSSQGFVCRGCEVYEMVNIILMNYFIKFYKKISVGEKSESFSEE